MENLIYILSGAVVILIFWSWRISRKIRKNRANIKKLNHDIEILKGRMTQAEGINLDLSVIENKVEENSQEFLSFVQQEIGEVNKNMRYLEERMDGLEKELENESHKMSEMENKIDEKEEE
jgi:chromosome segregation ATPase